MFKKIEEATSYIENRRVRHSYDYFKNMLDVEKIPYQNLPCIHVTGTNGKGGTINFIRYILQEAGYTVGTFTSPYILCHQDRFTINGTIMSEEDFLRLVNKNYAIIEKYNLSMFEADVLIMFQYFDENDIDIALIEVGIGGRNDKTNMISPKASIITNIGHDHLSQIGPALKDVAYEKAGIIKENIPVFIGEMEEDLINIFQKEAYLKHANISVVKAPKTMPFDYLGYQDITLHMQGLYHVKNACMALEVVKCLYPDIEEKVIRYGLLKATWPGRFEYFQLGNAAVYLDGAHNLNAIHSLIESVSSLHLQNKPIFIYAALRDKDYQEMAQLIRSNGYALEVCQFEDDRALSELQAKSIHASAFYHSIDSALQTIVNSSKTYIICGSLHFISQFRNKIIQK